MRKVTKFVVPLIITSLLISSCNGNQATTTNRPSEQITETTIATTVHEPSESSPETSQETTEVTTSVESSTQGEINLDSFLTSIMEAVQEELNIEISLMNESVDLGDKNAVKYNIGLEDAKDIQEIMAANAMISAQAYSSALIRVNEGVDAKQVAELIVKNVDPIKWVCVSADDVQAAVFDDLIYLVMLDSSMELNSVEDHFTALENVVGVEADSIVKR